MTRFYILFTLILFTFSIAFSQENVTTIAFGSCSKQTKDLSIFRTIVAQHPDLFIFLGDNIYADTRNMCKLKKTYKKLKNNAHFIQLEDSIPIIATWDDHDFGENDAGRHYPKKEASKKIFLDFFHEPKESDRYQHKGVYTSYLYPSEGKTIQIILLDTRTFRDDLLLYDHTLPQDTSVHYWLDYAPIESPDSTFLGNEQWEWLEKQLLIPADARIIGSSTQFGIEFNGYEAWANYPREQEKMLQLIHSTHAQGVFFISGDVHYAELSKMTNEITYPIYDLTSSGLTEEWKFATKNNYRLGNPIMENHFGMLEFTWGENPHVLLQIRSKENQVKLQQRIFLMELK